MKDTEITDADIDRLYKRINRDAEAAGYHLNPDLEFTNELIKSLIINEGRYGYRACPCRLASGNRKDDLDIICPCDYRDPDVIEYDSCYCALYVSKAVIKGDKKAHSIPERRPPPKDRKKAGSTGASAPVKQKGEDRSENLAEIPYPVWRCKVCGYLCAREQPPDNCPICKAEKDRFETFLKPTK